MIDSESERVDASVNSGNAHVPPGITILRKKKNGKCPNTGGGGGAGQGRAGDKRAVQMSRGIVKKKEDYLNLGSS